MRRTLGTLIAAAALAAATPAQLATSAAYQLLGEGLNSGGGGQCSASYAGHLELCGLGGERLTSGGFQLDLGFLGANDPQPSNLPVVFGVAAAQGPKEGGTVVTVTGLNFDKNGAAGTLSATVGGQLGLDVTVDSDTSLTLETPPGASGPADVAVTTVHGTGELVGAFLYTPAVLASPTAMVGGTAEIRNVGPVGGVFGTYWSDAATQIPFPPYGDILIGPLVVQPLIPTMPYPAPDGDHVFVLDVPDNPNLVGQTMYVQTAAFTTLLPPTLVLTNRAQTTFQ